ncbi:MAG: Carbonic anhydrase [Labilithrix sp.]|nr:Carbonic anhydrase [Labilithrix sp.]
MRNLVSGIHSFRDGYFKTNRELFEKLATEGQNPETLFITCSDSRVVPNLITQAAPGDLFIVRNVGNVVPRPTLPGGTAAAIEYAVEVLDVRDIVICGHTQCGAIDAVLNPEKMSALPMVKRWLAETEQVRHVVEERYPDLSPEDRLLVAVQENVLAQLEHLREYDFVSRRLTAGTLQINGWVFEIKTGQVYGFSPGEAQFLPLVR